MEFASSDQSAAIFDGAKPSPKTKALQYVVLASKNARQNGKFCQENNDLVSQIASAQGGARQAGALATATNGQGSQAREPLDS